jgi:hypothetical protein
VASYKIVILEQAINEIAESHLYYNTKLSGLGLEFEEEVFQLLELIPKGKIILANYFPSA